MDTSSDQADMLEGDTGRRHTQKNYTKTVQLHLNIAIFNDVIFFLIKLLFRIKCFLTEPGSSVHMRGKLAAMVNLKLSVFGVM